MFRILFRSPLISSSSCQSLLLTSTSSPAAQILPCASVSTFLSSSLSSLSLSSSSCIVGTGSEKKAPALSLFGSRLLFEQRRSGHQNFWGREGRPGWHRRRRMERERRLKIVEPNTPVMDQEYPLPPDNKDKIPPGLFGEEKEELSPEEMRKAQNGILQRINEQVKGKAHGRLFAVIHVNGKQFKVTPGDIIVVQEYFPPDVGDQIRFHKILLVGGKDFTLVGSPLLDQDLVRLEGTVIEKTLSYTKINFKMKKGKNFERYRFIKTPYTMVRINLIEMMQPLDTITSDTEKFSQQNQKAV